MYICDIGEIKRKIKEIKEEHNADRIDFYAITDYYYYEDDSDSYDCYCREFRLEAMSGKQIVYQDELRLLYKDDTEMIDGAAWGYLSDKFLKKYGYK